MNTWNTVKAWYDAGFALHWLRPKSKMPVNAGWTKGPRATLRQLKDEAESTFNIGVRLGKVSALTGGGFLGVIDCDVKSEHPHHLREMLAELKRLMPDVMLGTMVVESGRGNGSMHMYVRSKEPLVTRRLAQSKDMVEVKMPSAKPNAFQIEKLGEAKVAAGWRLRAAWEIGQMGEGSQVVMPPSIHPDTGKPYVYGWPPLRPPTIDDIAEYEDTGAASKEIADVVHDFKTKPVDLFCSTLPDDIIYGIISGDGVEDRSAFMFKAAIAMKREGFERDEILTVLTDREHFIGGVAYEHAKTNSRKRATEWVLKYTLQKAESEVTSRRDFEASVDIEELPPLDAKEAAEQEASLLEAGDWRSRIERNQQDGRPKNTFQNVLLILREAVGQGCFLRNEFSGRIIHGDDLPWGSRAGSEIGDEAILLMKDWMSRSYRLEVTKEKLFEAVTVVAHTNRFHPVREYLSMLEWDGESRVESWLKDYCAADAPEPYLSEVSRKFMVALVTRIYEPGRKFDYMLVLEGPKQGEGKSRTVEALASPTWAGRANFQMDHKDLVMALRGKWIVEMSELAGFSSKETETVKAFIAERVDEIRVPYGHLPERYPRQCGFIGTTNKEKYFTDETGNRRYWPVKVMGSCDVEGLEGVRDQLFAEAKWIYDNMGEDLWLAGDVDAQARAYQKDRMEHDILGDQIGEFLIAQGAETEARERLLDPHAFKMTDLFKAATFGGGPGLDHSPQMQRRVGKILRGLGYAYKPTRAKGDVSWLWVKA